MKKYFHMVVFLALLVSCEVDITDRFRDEESLFVVSAHIVAGEAPLVNLSSSVTLAELDTLQYLNDARVEVSKGEEMFILSPAGSGFYGNEELVPEPGDVLSFQCSREGMPGASVRTTVPEYPLLKEVHFKVDDQYNFILEVEFDDLALSRDHYSFFISGWSREFLYHFDDNYEVEWIDSSYQIVVHTIRIEDPVIEYKGGPRDFQHYDINEPWGEHFHFSDRLFDGMGHMLTVQNNLRYIYSDTIPELYVHLVKKDEAWFRFISTYTLYDPFPDQDFLQPVQVYSNIDGGFGLLSAESSIVDTIDLSEWYENPAFLEFMNPPEEKPLP